MATLAPPLESLRSASRPEDLFGALLGTRNEQLELLRASYRSLARATHPDVSPEPDAEAVFIKLERLYEEAQDALHRGRYGRARFQSPLVFNARYRVVESWEGQNSRHYVAETASGGAFLKLARGQKGDERLAHEAELLGRLSSDDATESRLKPYVPQLLDSFEQRTASGERRVNALKLYEGFYTLRQVQDAYPQGLPWRDAAWIMLRLLVAVGYAHANGIVHAAVLPQHVLVQPEEHGLVLVDWTQATEPGVEGREDVSELVAGSGISGWCPDELVLSKRPRPATDVYMAARTLQRLLGALPGQWQLPETVPTQLQAFLSGCAVPQPSRRPDDAWELRAELDELFGQRDFRPLAMPAASPQASMPTNPTNDSKTERSD